MDIFPMRGRMDSRDDVSVFVSNSINPIALQGTRMSSLAMIMGVAEPQIGSKVRP